MNDEKEKIDQYFIKNYIYNNYSSKYGIVEDHLFFKGHLFYVVGCSIYKDNHKILELPDDDFIAKIAVIDSIDILLIGMDNGYILSYHIYDHELVYQNKTKICGYDCVSDCEFINDIEVNGDKIIVDLNIRKESYIFNANGLLKTDFI